MKNLLLLCVLVLYTTSFSFAEIIYVPDNAKTIQKAIKKALSGDTVLVKPETYYENINFMGKSIVVGSLFLISGDVSHIKQTIIDGSLPGHPDSGSVVFFINGEDTNATLCGFTITNGSGTVVEDFRQNEIRNVRAGGGILCYNSSARILHNRIYNNHIPEYDKAAGGGVAGYPDGSPARVILKNNNISSNSISGSDEANGGAVSLSCNGILVNNDISYNSSLSKNTANGAVFCRSENQTRNVTIKNNEIKNNTTTASEFALGGGVSVEKATNSVIANNDISFNVLFNRNRKTMGGGLYLAYSTGTDIIDRNIISNNNLNGRQEIGAGIVLYENSSENSNSVLTNNLIFHNSAFNSSGIFTKNSVAQITNNTIVNNTGYFGGAIFVDGDIKPVVLNTIVWGNETAGRSQLYGEMIVAYSNIEGEIYQGENNISVNPRFSDDLYHLQSSSKCINAGMDLHMIEDVLYHAPLWDKEGNLRQDPAGSMPDIGAQEYRETVTELGIIENKTPWIFSLEQNYPNPFNPATRIGFNLSQTARVRLDIYTVLGEKLITLLDEPMAAGRHEKTFNARNLPGGAYFYRLQAGGFHQVRKMILLK